MTSCFELVELALDPAFHGRGIGGALHDAVLADLPNRTAVLQTWQGETAATALYRRRGWQELQRDFRPPGARYPAVLMGLELANRSAGYRSAVRSDDPETAP